MKPVNELSPEDFERARIWRFVQPDDGAPDETWVVATSYKTIPRDCYSLLVSARYVLADDRILPGFLIVTTATNPLEVTPGALLRPRYCVLPAISQAEARRKKYPWVIAQYRTLQAFLGAKPANFSPIQYFARVPIGRSRARLHGIVE